MGDRCYMSVHCRPEHAERFKDLGFDPLQDLHFDGEISVKLVDEEENKENVGELLTDIPYYGNHGSCAGAYDAAEFACDGQALDQWTTDENGNGYVLYHEPDSPAFEETLNQRRAFLDLQNRARFLTRTAFTPVQRALALLGHWHLIQEESEIQNPKSDLHAPAS